MTVSVTACRRRPFLQGFRPVRTVRRLTGERRRICKGHGLIRHSARDLSERGVSRASLTGQNAPRTALRRLAQILCEQARRLAEFPAARRLPGAGRWRSPDALQYITVQKTHRFFQRFPALLWPPDYDEHRARLPRRLCLLRKAPGFAGLLRHKICRLCLAQQRKV